MVLAALYVSTNCVSGPGGCPCSKLKRVACLQISSLNDNRPGRVVTGSSDVVFKVMKTVAAKALKPPKAAYEYAIEQLKASPAEVGGVHARQRQSCELWMRPRCVAGMAFPSQTNCMEQA